jgi:uncharacterized LabA/DUF88 family protein
MKLSDFLKRTYDSKDRVMIFIDGSNLYHGLKSECGNAHLDFLKFSYLLANKRKLIRTYFYTSTLDAKREPDKAKNQQRFLNALREIPYVTIKHRVLLYKGTPPRPLEKGVDILIATDMLTNALRDCYDTAILVSGDGDFAPVLEEITRAGKQIENAVFSSSRSDALISASDLFIELSKGDLNQCFRP